MIQVKLTKRMLNTDPQDLLIKLGAVDLKAKIVFPSEVYFSKADYLTLTKQIKKLFLKQYPGLDSRRLASAVGMTLLSYGPNCSLQDAIKPGYALVDVDTIERLKNEGN